MCKLVKDHNFPLLWLTSGLWLQTWSFSFYAVHVAFSRPTIYFISRDTVINPLATAKDPGRPRTFALFSALSSTVHYGTDRYPPWLLWLCVATGRQIENSNLMVTSPIINSLQRTGAFQGYQSPLSNIVLSAFIKVCFLCPLEGCNRGTCIQVLHNKSSPTFLSS